MAHAGRVGKAEYGTHRQSRASRVWHTQAKYGTNQPRMAHTVKVWHTGRVGQAEYGTHRQGREGRVWHTQRQGRTGRVWHTGRVGQEEYGRFLLYYNH
ncbi:hypothetical protein XENTR_v10001119 [Xenopus tropicalis]|nr:hypothetical protein XENTR_v10001119 [Xenopus tropicalis]